MTCRYDQHEFVPEQHSVTVLDPDEFKLTKKPAQFLKCTICNTYFKQMDPMRFEKPSPKYGDYIPATLVNGRWER